MAGPAVERKSRRRSFPFNKGSARFSLLLGSGTAFDQDYTAYGLGGGYFVMDGLEAGLDLDTWQGNTPRLRRVSPGHVNCDRNIYSSCPSVYPELLFTITF